MTADEDKILAERYSSTGETMADVLRRVNRERPETPHQILLRRQRENVVAEMRHTLNLIRGN